MPQSLVEIYVHIVFSTKGRAPFLKDREFRERTHAYLKGICENQGSPSLAIGGVEDHVHILCRLSKTGDVSTVVRELKRDSSKWIKANAQRLRLPLAARLRGIFGQPVANQGAQAIHCGSGGASPYREFSG